MNRASSRVHYLNLLNAEKPIVTKMLEACCIAFLAEEHFKPHE